MINDIFKKIKLLNVIDWGVIYLGCQGLPIGVLSPSDVSDYACDQLALTAQDDESFTSIAVLSLCSEINIETREEVYKICDQKGIDFSLSKQKWLVFALKDFMNDLSEDSLYGIIELNDFWNDWGETENSPNAIQGVNNTIGPNEFYSEKHYNTIVSKHIQWIDQELKKLGIPVPEASLLRP